MIGRIATLGPLALLLAACAAQNPEPPSTGSYVALLPNADGTVGRVSVQQGGSTIALDKPLQAASLAGPESKAFQAEEAQLKRDFGAAMEAMPPAPTEFALRFEADGARLTAESDALIPKLEAALKGRPSPEVIVTAFADYRELAVWNRVDNPMLLPTGEVLQLAPPAGAGGPPGPTHTVRAGETLAGIAAQYGQRRVEIVAERLRAAGVAPGIISTSVRDDSGETGEAPGKGARTRLVSVTIR